MSRLAKTTLVVRDYDEALGEERDRLVVVAHDEGRLGQAQAQRDVSAGTIVVSTALPGLWLRMRNASSRSSRMSVS